MKKIIAFLLLFTYQLPAAQVLTEEERIVALTLLGEARGEKEIGMFAVGCVIQKRALERNLTPKQVCLEHRQFKVWKGHHKGFRRHESAFRRRLNMLVIAH